MSAVLEPVEGDVRVVRADRYNFATERYQAIKSKDKATQEETTRYEWVVLGWYGSNLPLACKQAIRDGTHGADVAQLQASVERAEKVVVAWAEKFLKEVPR